MAPQEDGFVTGGLIIGIHAIDGLAAGFPDAP